MFDKVKVQPIALILVLLLIALIVGLINYQLRPLIWDQEIGAVSGEHPIDLGRMNH